MTGTFQTDTSFQRIETRSSVPLLLRAMWSKFLLTKRILSVVEGLRMPRYI